MIPKEVIDEIMATARIEEVIGEFVNLKRAGSSMKGLSPFAKERTPSFMVSPAKGIFKDFSSGKGGNVVTFIMEHEAMSYPEALKWLADKYNIEVPEEKVTEEQMAQRNERENLFLVNKFAQEHFEEKLWNDDQGRAIGLSYFKQRGFIEDTIRKFHLGYCLEQGNLLSEQATNAGYKEDHLLKLGLSKRSDKGLYDFFRGRVMFPIQNLTGRTVGFGGRTLRKDKKIAKYFNSPESEIYNKSEVLYGLYQAKVGIMREDNCFLVEGYTDVISMFQSGIDNAVSSSGTALTEGQIRLIHRYTPNITILYDGDAAGIKASFRGIDLILEQGLNVRIVLFPDGQDPDSFAQEHSEEELRAFLTDHAQDFITFKTELLLDESKADPIKKAGLIKQIIQSIALIPDQITRTVYIQSCSERFQMDEQGLITELNKLRYQKSKDKRPAQEQAPAVQMPVAPQQEQAEESSLLYHQEKDLIRLLLNYGQETVVLQWIDEQDVAQKEEVKVANHIVSELSMDDLALGEDILADIYQVFANQGAQGKIPGPEEFYTHHHPQVSKIAVELCTSMYELSDNWWARHKIVTRDEKDILIGSVESAIHSFKMKKLDQLIRQSQNKLKAIADEQTLFEELTHQKQLISARKILAEMMGRTVLK